jgi:hypothetical protein
MSEIRFERSPEQKLTALVLRGADRVLLRKCAESLSEDLGAEPCERFDGMDQVFWDFRVFGTPVTLHWKQAGEVFVLAQDPTSQSDAAVRRTAEHLVRRFGGVLEGS